MFHWGDTIITPIFESQMNSFHNAPLPGQFTSSIGARLIKVTAGSFVRGSPVNEPGHCAWEQPQEISLQHDYYLGEFPVTQIQYEAVAGANPTQFATPPPDAPADTVARAEAQEFCRQLSATDRAAGVLPNDWEYRLPTESEWEYAARAGNANARYGAPAAIAWYCANSEDRIHSVGDKLPNDWGFYDMLGNVWEYCDDWFHQGRGLYAVRGGSFFNSADGCRFASRAPWGRGRYVGFRLFAGPVGIACTPADASFPVDNIQIDRQVDLYDAIDRNDPRLAERVLAENPAAIEAWDEIPPPIFAAIWEDKPAMLEWLLDHGADIERRNQDYGTTPLVSAVISCHRESIAILVARGANPDGALAAAKRGIAGEFEDTGISPAKYQEIAEFLRELGIP